MLGIRRIKSRQTWRVSMKLNTFISIAGLEKVQRVSQQILWKKNNLKRAETRLDIKNID